MKKKLSAVIQKLWAKFDVKKEIAPEMTPDSDESVETTQTEVPEVPEDNQVRDKLVVTTQGFDFFDLPINEQEKLINYFSRYIRPILKNSFVFELYLNKYLRWFALVKLSDFENGFCVFTFNYPSSAPITFGGSYENCKKYLDEKLSSDFVIPPIKKG